MKSPKHLVLLFLLAITGRQLYAQTKEVITLSQLQALAKENYPLLKQKQMYSDMGTNKVKQLNSNFLPQINVTGQATYQSEVTEFGSYAQKADQYAIGVELKENLFDYGTVDIQKEIERQSTEMQSQQVDVDLVKLKERINQLYGSIYLQQENKKILQLRMTELDAKRKKMQSAVTNGAALQSNFLILEAEYLSTEQKIDESNSNLLVWFKTLTLLTSKNMDTSMVFADSGRSITLQSTIVRPEMRSFDLQSSSLKLKQKMIGKNNLPKFFVFGRVYYGRPGYNFLNNDFRPYGIVGAGLSWNISAYYTSNRESRNLQLNSDIVGNQKKIFELNLQTTILQQQEEISRLERTLASDAKIVSAKTSIRKSSSSQLDNGVITSSDFIVDLNSENQSQFNLKLHEIQLIMAKESYNTTLGY